MLWPVLRIPEMFTYLRMPFSICQVKNKNETKTQETSQDIYKMYGIRQLEKQQREMSQMHAT